MCFHHFVQGADLGFRRVGKILKTQVKFKKKTGVFKHILENYFNLLHHFVQGANLEFGRGAKF